MPPPGNSERPAPIVTALQRDADWETALPRLRAMGCNHVWLGWAAQELAPQAEAAGIEPVLLLHPAMDTPPSHDPSEWVHCYLKTLWKEKAEGPLSLPLSEVYDSREFYFDPRTDPGRVRVVARGSGRVLPPSAWEADWSNRRIEVRGGATGEQYRAIFPVAIVKSAHANPQKSYPPRYTDGVSSPERRALHYEQVRAKVRNFPEASVFRPTSLQYFFLLLWQPPAAGEKRGDYMAYSAYAYWAGMNPARLALYEARYGEAFDPLWIMERGYGEEGYLPHPAYRRWIDLMREEVGEYARGMNDIIHAGGRRSRWFWGDDWKGVEPYLGDVDRAGFDEVVLSLSGGAPSVRRLTGFSSPARRIMRLPWINLERDHPEIFHERWAEHWRWIRRETFVRCPAGITVGGDVRGAFDAGLGEPIVDTMREFRKIHSRIYEKRLFDNDGLTFYIADAWGPMRAWTVPCHYVSRTETLKAMVDWPVKIRFVSFDQIASGGVPDDAALLIIAGEPDTAWAGGDLWENPELVGAVRAYVEGGGGLLAMGGASLTGGTFALGDLLGIAYREPATARAADRLWNVTRWVDAGRSPSAFDTMQDTYLKRQPELVEDRLPPPLRGDFGLPAPSLFYGDTLIDARATAAVIARDADGGPAAVLASPGRGRAGYLAGYGNNPRFLKVLSFYLAGAMDALARLDSDHPSVAVYAYPEERLAIVFNHGPRAVDARVRLDPAVLGLAAAEGGLLLRDLDEGRDRPVSREALREGIDVSLDPGQTVYWRLETP
ncbi:MAG: hypothetical protein JW951_07750 [Lentisphaerae bacterium]|nr:hypothetical protein [Lentisphaerota bacterium]